MIDLELVDEVRDVIFKIQKNIIELEDTKAEELLNSIASKFIKNRKKLWWWESLSVDYNSTDYGAGRSCPLIEEYIGEPNKIIYLIITDDESDPWMIFKGKVVDIMELLSEMWRFEYFLTDEKLSWLIFDTHHNELVITKVLDSTS